MRTASGVTALFASAVLALTGCTNSERPSTATDTTTGPTTSAGAPTATKTFGKACDPAAVKVEGGFGEPPKVTLPDDCDPPTELVIRDLVPGADPAVKAGDAATVNYQLTAWGTRAIVDDSFGRNEPFEVSPVGQARVIEGWNEGLIGLKTGGRRLLIIPPDKGYGPMGNPPSVGPDETLVFVIDGVRITSP